MLKSWHIIVLLIIIALIYSTTTVETYHNYDPRYWRWRWRFPFYDATTYSSGGLIYPMSYYFTYPYRYFRSSQYPIRRRRYWY